MDHSRSVWRATLVTAEGFYSLAFVHAASLIADSVVLISRGFDPLDDSWRRLGGNRRADDLSHAASRD